MSTRWYPFYQKGNPQLRVFLPNFWMKLVKPEYTERENVVQFHCSMEMSRYDIKNYLEKIYKVPVMKVNTRIALGKTRKNEVGVIVKDDDIKVAYVFLPRNDKFVFPNLFDDERKKKEEEKQEDSIDEAKDSFKSYIKENDKIRPGLPPWFSI